MRKFQLTTWVWAFIVAVALADIYFSWQCQSSMLEWELNPVAARMFQWGGAIGMVLYRAGILGYAAAMSFVKTRFSWLVAPVWGLMHLYLLVVLARVYPYLPALQR